MEQRVLKTALPIFSGKQSAEESFFADPLMLPCRRVDKERVDFSWKRNERRNLARCRESDMLIKIGSCCRGSSLGIGWEVTGRVGQGSWQQWGSWGEEEQQSAPRGQVNEHLACRVECSRENQQSTKY